MTILQHSTYGVLATADAIMKSHGGALLKWEKHRNTYL